MTPGPGLETLTLEVDTRCNLRCTNCFALADLPSFSGMPRETAFAIAREGHACGFRRLHLTGGEPLLWPHLFALLKYARDLGYERLYFNTNGTYLDQHRAEQLRAFGERLAITVSINGPAHIHDATRGAGSHAQAQRGLSTALAAGLRVEVFTTVERSLLPRLTDFLRDLFSEHPQIVRVTLIQNHRVENDYYDVSAELLTPEELVALVTTAGLLNLGGYTLAFLDHALVNALGAVLGLALPPSPPRMRFGHLTVLRNLSISASHSSRAALGQYTPGALRTLLASPAYAARYGAADPACAGCEFQELCARSGNPRATPPDMYEAPSGPAPADPYCRRALSAAQTHSLA